MNLDLWRAVLGLASIGQERRGSAFGPSNTEALRVV
jgi:hypothetical protein